MGEKAFGTSLIIKGLSGLLDTDNYQMKRAYYHAFNGIQEGVKLNIVQLDEATKWFGFFTTLISLLFVCAGASVISERRVGPKLSIAIVLTYTWFFANPYHHQEAHDQSSIWILLIKNFAMLGCCLLLELRGRITESSQDVRLFRRGSPDRRVSPSRSNVSSARNSPAQHTPAK